MKKLLLSLSFLMIASLFVFSSAQTEKTIIIKKKTIDANGNETVEEITHTGEDAINIDINEYLKEKLDGQEIDIDINIEKIIGENSNLKDINVLKFNGKDFKNIEDLLQNNPEISSELKERLQGLGISEDGIQIFKFGEENMIFEDMDEIFDGSEFQLNWNGCQNQSIIIDENDESKTFLGVWPGESTNDKGVLLGGIVDGSAAENAGLQEGDIITNIAGKPTKSFSQLAAIIKEHKPNDNVVIQYIRNNESRSTNVTLGEKKTERSIAYVYDNNQHQNHFSKEDLFMRGMKSSCCTHDTEVEKAYIGIMISNSEKGVEIVDVNREDDILSNQDIITKFGRTDISDINELIDAVAEYQPGDKVKIHYVRDGKNKKSKVKLLGRMVKGSCTVINCCANQQTEISKQIIIKTKKDDEIKSDLGNGLLELQDVNLFPNPTEGNFKLEFTSDDLSPIIITINDSNGREIIKDEIGNFNGRYSGSFNLQGNTPGLYLVNIIQSGKILTQKVIVK